MNSSLPGARISALAYLYDNVRDFPEWLRRLTPKQMEDIAKVMAHWQLPDEDQTVIPMEEIVRREMLRAVKIFRGDVLAAANALKIGKTTIYRKLKDWGYTIHNRILVEQASVLADRTRPRQEHFW